MDNSFRRSRIRFRRHFFPRNYMRSLRQWWLYTASQIFQFPPEYTVYCTIYGSLRRKFINTTKCGRAKCTHRFVFHSRRTLPRCKFIQFQSHEYLHLSLTTLRIHLAGKIGKINNNDDARYAEPWAVSEKGGRRGLKLNKFSVVGRIVRNFCTHRATLASETQMSGGRKCGVERGKKYSRIGVWATKGSVSCSYNLMTEWLLSRSEVPSFFFSPGLTECSFAAEKVRRTSYLSPGAKGLSACRHITL